jgi:hypothetical protein
MLKKAFTVVAICGLLAIALTAWSGSTVLREFMEYTPEMGAVPGELYFIAHSNATDAATSIVWTNLQAYMWYPQKIRLTWNQLPITNTLAINQIKRLRTDYYLESEVVTNEFGNIATNFLHQLTNTAYSTWTNTLYPSASSICTGGTISVALPYEYMQKGDSLSITWSYTNVSPWVTIFGRR